MLSTAKQLGRTVFPSLWMFGPLLMPEFTDQSSSRLREAMLPTADGRQGQEDIPPLPNSLITPLSPTSSRGEAPKAVGGQLPILPPPLVTKHDPTSSSKLRFPNSRVTSSRTLLDEYHSIIKEDIEIHVELIDEGVGGTYFFKTKTARGNKKLAIFKPADEEPGAVNNPKGYSEADENEKGDIKPGEGWIREILAHRLDHFHFANVPETIEVKLPNRLFEKKNKEKGCKFGSLQKFVQNSDGSPCKASCDMGPGTFPTDDAHRIGQLDIRLLNCDRHGGNALVQKDARGGLHLVPIDHSYILPKHAADLDFEWLFWPQSKEPFNAETIAYIAALQPDSDAAILRKYGMEEECIELMQAATMTLQRGCAQGLSLRTIGRFMRRERMYELSGFENVVLEARRPLEQGGDIEFSRLNLLLDERLGALCESPLAKPVRSHPITLKEQVLAVGVRVEAMTSDPEGTYFIKGPGGVCIAVFKSSMPQKGRGLYRGKDLVSREVAAYKLDENWAGVPETIEMRIPNELFPKCAQLTSAPFKHGSLQRFIDGSAQPLCEVPVESLAASDVHRLGILDIRLCNPDRHCRSMLFVQHGADPARLVPTSHGGILPPSLSDLKFPWSHWPQAQVPFSSAELDYIQRIEPEVDARLLADLGIGAESIEVHQVATLVLKSAAELRLQLRQVGLLFERPTLTQPSWMECLLAEVRTSLDEGGLVDFRMLKNVLVDRLAVLVEGAPGSESEGSDSQEAKQLCCSCSRNGTRMESEPSDSEESCFSFADSEASSFSWEEKHAARFLQ